MARLLLIEDNAILRDMYVMMLERDGHSVTVATDGVDGLAKFRAAPPEIVLTDMAMPRLDGIGFMREAIHDGSNVPVIAMSGGSSDSGSYLESARLLGASAILTKPFSLMDLRSAVTHALQIDSVVRLPFQAAAAI